MASTQKVVDIFDSVTFFFSAVASQLDIVRTSIRRNRYKTKSFFFF